jgi:hypothetical protein
MSFWGKDPCSLFSNLSIIPCPEMSKDEKLNSITRLVLLICLVLYFMEYKNWLVILVISLSIILLVYVTSKNREGFTLTPTYTDTDFTQTTVAPLFAEEWQIPPPAYDLMQTNPLPSPPLFEEPMLPQSYPYGQLLSGTNLLPSDEYMTHMLDGGTQQARSYANSAFLRSRLAFQDNMSRVLKKKLRNRFRGNCSDTYSPYSSY